MLATSCPISHRTDAGDHHPKLTTATFSPATSPPRPWKRKTAKITPASPPRSPGSRRVVHLHREPLHRRHRWDQSRRTSPELTIAVSCPPLLCDPSDQDPKDPVRSLIETVQTDPSHPIHFRSYGSGSRSGRTGISQWHHATWPVSRGKIENRIGSWQNYVQTLENHIFWSVIRKIANDIPLESLEHLESSNTIKSYILWVQFETIFKLESDLLLAWLIHIFCSANPKITIL
jgi:hypothetical protein